MSAQTNQVFAGEKKLYTLKIAEAIGRIHPNQKDLLTRSLVNQGLKPIEAMKLVNIYQTDEPPIELTNDMKIDYLLDLSTNLLIDDELDGKEMIVLKSIGLRLGVSPHIMDMMIQEVIQALVTSYNIENAKCHMVELLEID